MLDALAPAGGLVGLRDLELEMLRLLLLRSILTDLIGRLDGLPPEKPRLLLVKAGFPLDLPLPFPLSL
jgi:hypothetical protein